jgi:periplasmic protein TonB
MKRHDIQREPPVAALSQENGRLESFAGCLIRYGARHAPPSLAERLEEEWLADLGARRGPLSQLRFALGCCWASRVIAHELAAAVRTAASAAGPKSVTLYAQADPSLLSPRAAMFLLILCLHALVIYALAAGLARRVFEEIAPPINVLAVDTATPRQPPPPLPPLRELQPAKIENVEPVIPIETPPDPNAVRDAGPANSEHPLPPPREVSRIVGGPGAGFPHTEDFYPAASRRIGETGVVTVRVCVDATGRLTGDPAIAQSSGSVRLDEGALKLARAGSGRYRATTEDGRAVSSCYPYRVRFELRD